MSRPATDAEAGRGLRRDPAEPVPEGLRHDVERIDDHDGPPFDRCPARELPSRVEARADRAREDDGQVSLSAATGDYRRLTPGSFNIQGREACSNM